MLLVIPIPDSVKIYEFHGVEFTDRNVALCSTMKTMSPCVW